MSILPVPRPSVPSASPAVLPVHETLLVRISVLTPHARRRHDTYVRIGRAESDSETDLFLKAVREYRYRHGYVEQIVAIDLMPGQ